MSSTHRNDDTGFTIQPRWRLSFHVAPGPEPQPRGNVTRLRLFALGGWRLSDALQSAPCHPAFPASRLEPRRARRA